MTKEHWEEKKEQVPCLYCGGWHRLAQCPSGFVFSEECKGKFSELRRQALERKFKDARQTWLQSKTPPDSMVSELNLSFGEARRMGMLPDLTEKQVDSLFMVAKVNDSTTMYDVEQAMAGASIHYANDDGELWPIHTRPDAPASA